MFRAMNFKDKAFTLLDQRFLPVEERWIPMNSLEGVAVAIENMTVRGAPAIGCTAAWGLAVDAIALAKTDSQIKWSTYRLRFQENVARLARTRPTAVNLFYALDFVQARATEFDGEKSIGDIAESFVKIAEELEVDDIRTCKAIGEFGYECFNLNRPMNVLTHCNTGSLATAGYGTALGIIRSLHRRGLIKTVFVDETRPYLQGSRLTAYELGKDGIPYKLIADNMAGFAMQKKWIDLVVIGADRIAANGDTANKIGSYSLAVLCKHHGVPFVVAAPTSTIDAKIKTGAEIPVEERSPKELLEVQGLKIAPQDSQVWNPSFDVTPSELISHIVTEKGVFTGPFQF